MDSLLKALQKLEEATDKQEKRRYLSMLYNSFSDCSDLGNLHEDLLDQIKSLSDRHKRYMCVLAIKLRSLPVFQCFFANELAPVTEENLSEDNIVFCELMYDECNLFYKDFMSAAIHVGFPKGIKFMCDQDLKFDPEVLDDWCFSFMKESEDWNKDFPSVRRPGMNKYKQLEDITRHFASRGDADMLARILGRDDTERTRARKYIKHVEPALVSVVDVDETEEERAVKCLEMFVSAGADLNRPTSRIVNGFETSPTPLMIAALLCKAKIFECLIQNGADVNRRDRLGENALHYLINSEKDTTACIDRIFSAGYRYEINVDKMIRITYTPLHLAVVRNKIAIARKLIDRGADIHLPDRKGKNLIHHLAEIDSSQFSLELAKFLINSGLDKELRDVEGQTPLFAAVKNKNTALVKLLLEERCEMDSLCAYNTSSPLLMACEVFLSGQEDILLLLLESKCDVNFPNDVGVVALMKAAEYPSTDLASLLLRYGADVNRQDSQGMFASAYCFKKKGYLNQNSCTASEMFRCLLDHGFDVRKHNADNQLLHMALLGSVKDCFSLLVELLEPFDQVTKAGETLFHFFARLDSIRIAEFENLFAKYVNLGEQTDKNGVTPMMVAAYLLNKRYLEIAIKCGQDVNACDRKDQAALHFCLMGFACRYEQDYHSDVLECARLLIDAGADVNVQDRKGRTPLMMAAMLMDEKLIAMLLEVGADPDMVDDKHGISPLQLLRLYTHNDRFFRCLKLFVSYGCDFALDIPDTYSFTLIQAQFLSISGHTLPNIYLLLSANCSVFQLSTDNGSRYISSLHQNYFDFSERDKFRKLLFLCGASLDEILKVVEPSPVEEEEHKCTEKFNYFCNNISLRSRCRRVIRQTIGGNIKAKLRELTIPPGLYDFLLVKDSCLVEETAIPGKYFEYDVMQGSRSERAEDDEEFSSHLFDSDPDRETFFSDWYNCLQYKSFKYFD